MQLNYNTSAQSSLDKKRNKFFYAKKLFLTTFCLVLFFLVLSFTNIRAQIASLISEDGDGLIGVTSLMNATINNDLDSVQFFARNDGVKVVNQRNIGGATALHIAARNGNFEIVKVLIENGANVNIADNEGWAPLARAITSKNYDIVKLMVESGADAGKMNSEKETSIIISASSDCVKCLEYILSSYDFTAYMTNEDLWDQVNRAMKISNRKNNELMRSLLKEYVGKKLGKTMLDKKNSQGRVKKFVIPKVANDDVITIKSLDGDSNSKIKKRFISKVSKKTEATTKSYKTKSYKLNKAKEKSDVKIAKPNFVKTKPIKTQKFIHSQAEQEDYNLNKSIHYDSSTIGSAAIENKSNPQMVTDQEKVKYKFTGETKSYPQKVQN